MIKPFLLSSATIVFLSGCSNTHPCEDILEVKRQEQVCKRLQQVISNPKNPQQGLTARKRFEAECVNLRYYRDDYDTICKGTQTPIGQPSHEKP